MAEPRWIPNSVDDWLVLLGNANIVITVLDEHAVVLNQFNADGSPLTAQIGQPLWGRLPAPPQATIQQALQQLRTTGAAQVVETVHEDGEQWYRHAVKRLPVNQEAPVFAVYSTNISAEKQQAQHMEQLHLVERRFRAIFEHSSDGIIIAERLHDVAYGLNHIAANRANFDMLGYTVEEMRSLELGEALPPDQLELSKLRFDRLEEIKLAERQCFRKDGTLLHLESMVVPIHDDDGKMVETITFVRDITERKHYEENLLREKANAELATQAKDRFIANISHELRTPLNVILGFAGLLHEDATHDGAAREYLDYILSSGRHLARLVNDMLDASRIDLEKFHLEETTVDLLQLIGRIARSQIDRARTSGLTFAAEIKPDVPQWIRADEIRLRQIIINLVDNAIKYTERGIIELRVSYTSDTEELHIEVLDTGIGIPESMLDDIFDVFVRVGNTNKESSIGLGLYITRSLVKLMGGTISAQNRAAGGSAFRVTLPLKVAAPECLVLYQEPATPVALVNAHGKYRVMVVEDVAANAALLEERLTRWGFAVEVVRDGSTALAGIRAWQPHLILLDLFLPGVDGFTLAGQIREDAQLRETAIIALTASAIPAHHERARANGCDAVLTKPINVNLLANTMAALLMVDFTYESSSSLAPAERAGLASSLSAADLRLLPSAWLRRMYVAAATASPDEALTLIGEIANDYPAIAATLHDLIEAFNLSRIADLIEDIMNEE